MGFIAAGAAFMGFALFMVYCRFAAFIWFMGFALFMGNRTNSFSKGRSPNHTAGHFSWQMINPAIYRRE
jgi:hypothetical protein